MGKRLIISEEERQSILSMHNKRLVSEVGPDADNDPSPQQQQAPQQQAPQQQAPQQQAPQQQASQQQASNITTLQNKLNEKFNSGLKVDGKWGPSTATAVLNALKSLQQAPQQQAPQQQAPQQQAPNSEPTQKIPTLKPKEIKSNTPAPLAGA